MKLISRFIGAGAVFLSALFSAPSFAFGELENVTLTVYVYPVGAPQAFLETDLTRPQGIDIDVIHELQRRLRFNLKENRIFPIARDAGFARLKNGTADMVGGGISYTVSRAQLYDFSPVFYSSSLAVVYSSRYNKNIRNVADLKGKKIGVERGSTSESMAEKFGATPVYFTNNLMALFQVANGDLDGIIYDRPPVNDFAVSVPSAELALTDDKFGEEECLYAFALAKASPYTEIISNTIEEMLMDGTIDRILEKWGAAK